jgi:hypothetical protein
VHFCTFASQMRNASTQNTRDPSCMEDFTDDQLLLDLIHSVAADVLTRIGDDPEMRYQYFRAIVDLSKRTVDRMQN